MTLKHVDIHIGGSDAQTAIMMDGQQVPATSVAIRCGVNQPTEVELTLYDADFTQEYHVEGWLLDHASHEANLIDAYSAFVAAVNEALPLRWTQGGARAFDGIYAALDALNGSLPRTTGTVETVDVPGSGLAG